MRPPAAHDGGGEWRAPAHASRGVCRCPGWRVPVRRGAVGLCPTRGRWHLGQVGYELYRYQEPFYVPRQDAQKAQIPAL